MSAPIITPRADATRGRIEAVAEALFRRLGYQKTTVADIARELGMSPANIYRFYPSKSAINEAIAARMLGAIEAGAWEIARGPGPATERMRLLLRHLHARHMAEFYQDRRLHDMVTAAMAEHWGVIERFLQAILGAIRHVVMDGIASGEFGAVEPHQTASAIKQAIMCFNHPALVSECMLQGLTEAELGDQAERMTGFVLRALRP